MDKKLERLLVFTFPADFWLGLWILLTAFEVGTWQPDICLILGVINAAGGYLDWLVEKIDKRK